MLAEIERILLHEWDAIGVNGVPEAADEYHSYAFKLYVRIQSRPRPSLREIEAYLDWAQTDRMAMEPTPDRNHRAAGMIAAL